jgi:transcriptional regulator with XRE-family HTH domain
MECHVSIGELARQIGVTTVFISRVELGKAPPLTPDRIEAVARVLGVSSSDLIRAAARQRGAFEIPITGNRVAERLCAAMLRAKPDMTEAQYLAYIERHLKGDDDE